MGQLILNTQQVNLSPANQEDFENLLKARKVDDAKGMMSSRQAPCLQAWNEYNVKEHKIKERPDKPIKDKDGNVIDKKKLWKLPIPYQVYINEVALVFLFGRPVRWQQTSQGANKAFERFQKIIKDTHFNAKIRQCKRAAGSETESALLFRLYRDNDGQPNMQLRVLRWSRGDEIYTRFDQYDNLLSFAWGYYLKTSNNDSEYHLDVYTKGTIYFCKQGETQWDVQQYENVAGKIPVILFRQEKEWAGVEELIFREETIASKTADTNDYFSDPIMKLAAQYIKNMPKGDAVGKTLIFDGEGADVNNVAGYLTWDSMPQSKAHEIDWLHDQILSKTFTPDIKLDTLKSLGNLSGKALQTVMLLAKIKADKSKEIYDEMLDRTASLLVTIIGNVLDVSLKSECDKLTIDHIWQEPFGEDVANALSDIINAYDANILSQESALEQNPLVRDVVTEKKRLEQEQEKRQQQEDSLYNRGEGTQRVEEPQQEEEEA